MASFPLYRNQQGVANLNHLISIYILNQIEMALRQEVSYQNTFASEGSEEIMREVRNVASTMREAIAALKQRAGLAVANFESEVNNAHSNLDNVDSVTHELKEANKEVESMLGESGSNFTPVGPDGTSRPVDENGVWVNPEHKKDA